MAETEELTTSEASARYGVSGSYLLRLAKEGTIKGRQRGPIWFVDSASVAAWQANHRKRGGSQKGVPWSKKGSKKQRQQRAEANHQPAMSPTAPVARLVLPTPPASAAKASQSKQTVPTPPAPTETTIDTLEGAHITIDPLQPDRQRWMHAEAIKGDVTAWCDIRPYPDAHWPGAYVVDYYYDRKDRNKKGAIGRNQEERAQALMFLLRDQLTQALQAAGWQTLTKTPSGQTLWHYRPGQQKEAQS